MTNALETLSRWLELWPGALLVLALVCAVLLLVDEKPKL